MLGSAPSADFEPRAICMQCRRPESVCYCAHLPRLDTETRVVILQHPRERDMPIGTAHMASLCLTNAEMHTGVTWEDSAVLARVLSDSSRPAALLYPGDDAVDIACAPPAGPITLVVLDGTWWQAKKLVRENPTLAKLPRYAFTPRAPSEYRIRREPADVYVSTIEAIAHVLSVLEPEGERFHGMLTPFRAMIDAQIACVALHRGKGSRHPPKAPASRRPPLPALLRDESRAQDLVCVVGEANAWPYRDAGKREPGHSADELVHWCATRVATGERFDAIVAPRAPLAPNTCRYVELSPEELARGLALEDTLARWRGFVRDTDVICSWGYYGTSLFASSGGFLPKAHIDLRQAARMYSRGPAGTIEDFITRLVPMPQIDFAPESRGRGASRVAQLTAVARRLAASA